MAQAITKPQDRGVLRQMPMTQDVETSLEFCLSRKTSPADQALFNPTSTALCSCTDSSAATVAAAALDADAAAGT